MEIDLPIADCGLCRSNIKEFLEGPKPGQALILRAESGVKWPLVYHANLVNIEQHGDRLLREFME